MIDVRLRAAVDGAMPVGFPIYPNLYTGDELEYIVTNYTTLPVLHAGDRPGAARYLIQVHYYLPHKKDPNPIKLYLSWALFHAGCTWPTITPNGDSEGQGYVFECEYTDGGGYYGSDPT